MKCIVGLGNPGKEYEKTRHNVGFMVIDELCRLLNVEINQKKFKAHFGQTMTNGEKVLLVKPQTFMNFSGEALRDIVGYFKIELEDILVISDDLDLPVGTIRFRHGGNDGGQRGIRNITQELKSKNYDRCRVGIDNNKLIPTVDYVLGKVEKEKLDLFTKTIEKAAKGCEHWITHDLQSTMNSFNGVIE